MQRITVEVSPMMSSRATCDSNGTAASAAPSHEFFFAPHLSEGQGLQSLAGGRGAKSDTRTTCEAAA
jgi:hypothetical protein